MIKTRYTSIFVKKPNQFCQKLLLVAFAVTLFFSARATDYKLVGDASSCVWSNVSHWDGSNFPSSLVAGDRIFIDHSGAVLFSDLDMDFTLPADVTMIIRADKHIKFSGTQTLMVDAGAYIDLETNAGIFISAGDTLLNNGYISTLPGEISTYFTVAGGVYYGSGVVITDFVGISVGGKLTVGVGGKINIQTEFSLRDGGLGSTFTVNGVINMIGTFVPALLNSGTVKGSGTWNGSFNFSGEGKIEPGNSPGILMATNGFNQGGAELIMEINGTTPGTLHDQLAVSGGGDTITTSSKLKLVFGADAAVNDTFNIITSSGGFDGTYLAANISLVRTGTNVGDVEITYLANKIQIKILSIVLPIELVDFSAKITENRTVNLTWQTASETNNRGFEIQFSTDFNQNEWKTIGFVAGNGTTTDLNDYQFNHKNTPSGQLFYRLRQLDFDGKSDLSPVRSVKILAKTTAQFEPSMVENGETTLHFLEETPAQNGLLRIFSADGKLVFEQNLEAENERFFVRLSGFSSGIFTAQLIFDNERPQVLRLVVR
jgi:hypothetical protein